MTQRKPLVRIDGKITQIPEGDVISQDQLTNVPVYATRQAAQSEITNKPTFSSIATSGSASDITSGTLDPARLPTSISSNTTGSAAKLTTSRTLTVGNTGKTFDGSSNVSWSLAEIGAVPTNSVGAASGVAPLGADGKVASAYLPSYVDDVLEFANLAAFPTTGETGKIYVADNTGKIYRWSGTAYIEISPSPGSTDAVPEGSTNLYFTTARAASAAPVQSVNSKSGAVALTKADVGLGNVDNTSDANKPISTATQSALNGKQDALGFTPVQQGTGVGQSWNTVKIGWSGSNLKVTVDVTDLGNFWLTSNFNPDSKANVSGATFSGAIAVPQLYISGLGDGLWNNGSGIQYNGQLYLGLRPNVINAAANGWVTNPRIFVQAGDPGNGAADGDLWIW